MFVSREAFAAGCLVRRRRHAGQQLQPRRTALPIASPMVAARRPCCSVPCPAAAFWIAPRGHRIRLLDDSISGRSAARWPSAWAVRASSYLDAPVDVARNGAKAGSLSRVGAAGTWPSGAGPPPCWRVVGKAAITHLGPVGCGQQAKAGQPGAWWPAATRRGRGEALGQRLDGAAPMAAVCEACATRRRAGSWALETGLAAFAGGAFPLGF